MLFGQSNKENSHILNLINYTLRQLTKGKKINNDYVIEINSWMIYMYYFCYLIEENYHPCDKTMLEHITIKHNKAV